MYSKVDSLYSIDEKIRTIHHQLIGRNALDSSVWVVDNWVIDSWVFGRMCVDSVTVMADMENSLVEAVDSFDMDNSKNKSTMNHKTDYKLSTIYYIKMIDFFLYE